jgi:hypothetical protein
LELVVPLFDAHRQLYRQDSDEPLARRFLLARFERHESTILLAVESPGPAGFAQ